MAAIYRIQELSGGRVLIDGVDCNKITLNRLRRHLSIIPQVHLVIIPSFFQFLSLDIPMGLHCQDPSYRKQSYRNSTKHKDLPESSRNLKCLSVQYATI